MSPKRNPEDEVFDILDSLKSERQERDMQREFERHEREKRLYEIETVRKEMLEEQRRGLMNASSMANAMFGAAQQNSISDRYNELLLKQMTAAQINPLGAIHTNPAVQAPPFDPNEVPFWSMPLQSLVDSWQLSFGSGWVSEREVGKAGADWTDAGIPRLTGAAKLEHLRKYGDSWFRLRD